MDSGKIHEIISSYNRFWITGAIDSGITRDVLERCVRQLETKEIILLKGVRRSGKSTLMAQIIRYLLEQGKSPQQVLRINLEEPLLAAESSIELLERIYRVYRDQVNPSGRCYLFLDEIQNIPQWEKWVRGRSETEDVKMVVAGSSSRLLSREAGTKLTGRHISFEIVPLSFVEFIRFNELTVKSKEEYYLQKSTIRQLFTAYMHYGGFPEVVLRRDSEQKELLLKQYFEDILHRDVVSRYEIRDTMTLQNLGVFLMTNIGRLTSITNLKKNLNVSQDKVENYLSALMESYLLFRVPKFDFSMKKSIRARFKPYAVDTGLRNRVSFSFSGDTGWLAENIVLNHLRTRHEEIYYHANGGDIDFIVKEGMNVTGYIQVWFDDAAETTVPERELRSFEYPALSKVSAEYLLLTNDLDTSMTVGEKNIRCLPITMFLLDIK